MGYSLIRLQNRATKLGWNLEKENEKYVIWKTEEDKKVFTCTNEVVLFLNEERDKNKVKKFYSRKFVEVERTVAKLGFTLHREEWWSMMRKKKNYKVTKNGENSEPIRFEKLIEVDIWCDSQQPSK